MGEMGASRGLCIFDLDGTILNTLYSIARAGNKMLAELGFPPLDPDVFRYYSGNGSDTMARRCLKASDALTEENLRAGVILARRFLAEDPLYRVQPYEGEPEALRRLKDKGFRLAVFSNKPDAQARAAVEGCYGTELFDAVLGQTDRLPLKPDPAGALELAARFGVEPERCYYVGDTATDMETGRAAGMRTAGVLWGFRDEKELRESGAQVLLKKPEELSLLPELFKEAER